MKRNLLIAMMVLGAAVANAQLTIVDNVSATWMDISSTGTALNLTDDGEADVTMTAGNFVFGAGTIRVGNNGGVRFAGVGTELSFSNQAIPSASAFSGDQSLLAFWDDIDSDTGNVYWEEIAGTMVIQWDDRPFFSNTPEHITMQMQIHSSGSALAQILYRDVSNARADGGGSATIGYQNGGAGQNDFQWSFNTAGSVANGDVLTVQAVPEPASMIALGLGAAALLRRRKKA